MKYLYWPAAAVTIAVIYPRVDRWTVLAVLSGRPSEGKMTKRKPAAWKYDGRIVSERKDCAMFIVGRLGSHPTIFVEAQIGDGKEQKWFNKQIALLRRRMCAPLVERSQP